MIWTRLIQRSATAVSCLPEDGNGRFTLLDLISTFVNPDTDWSHEGSENG